MTCDMEGRMQDRMAAWDAQIAEADSAEVASYARLGMACEASGLGWYENGEMRFQPPVEAFREELARAYDNLKEARRYWRIETSHAENAEARLEVAVNSLNQIRKIGTFTDKFGTSFDQAARIAIEGLSAAQSAMDPPKKNRMAWRVGYRGEPLKITIWDTNLNARRTLYWANEKPTPSVMKLLTKKHGDVLCELVLDQEAGV